LNEAKLFAKSLGFDFYFDWEAVRSQEGYYRVQGSVEFCARRAQSFLKYSDLVWMETDKPKFEVAKKFSELVLKHHPTKMLAYNLSPSFNWSQAGFTDQQLNTFCQDIGKLGFVW